MSLKNKVLNYLNTNKSAQGSLVAVVAASVILSVIVASATQWYLAFNKNLNVSGDSLTGMSIAKDIWDKMTTQDFEEMKGKAGTTETSDVGGYTVTREYGQAGVFDESTGECKVGSGSPTADNPRACMDVTIKVTDKDGKQVFTATPTRVSQNLGNYYVKNDNFPKEFKVAMEDEDESVEMPEGKAIYAYVDGQKVPLSSQGGGTPEPDYNNPKSIYITNWSEKSRKQQESPSYGPPYFLYYYGGTLIMPETGFLEKIVKSSTGFGLEGVCGALGCAQVGYNVSLNVLNPGMFSTSDLYYVKKGTAVSVSADCGERSGAGTCNLSKLKNDFYVVYYPPKKKS